MSRRLPTHKPDPDLSVQARLADLLLAGTLDADLIAGLRAGRPLVVALAAPDRWIDHVVGALQAKSPAIRVVESDAKPALRRAAEDSALEALAQGDATICVAPRLDAIPDAVLRLADATAILPEPGGKLLRRLVRERSGADPGPLPPGLAAGLEPRAIAAAFRPGAEAAEIVARLRALAGGSTSAPAPGATPGPKLEDLHGYGEAAAWAAQTKAAIERLRAGEIEYADLPSPGAILSGPPGVGKTLFAGGLARSLALPLVVSSLGAWFVGSSGYLDGVLKAATRCFEEAQAARGKDGLAILFLDEIDSLPSRETLSDRSREYWTAVTNHLLALCERAAPSRQGLILLGATNDWRRLDPALLRPGRFERVIELSLPDAQALAGILKTHAPEIDEGERAALGHLLAGRSGADVAALVREARALAGPGAPIDAAALRAVLLRPDGASEGERRLVAIHEAGHALVAAALGLDLRTVSVMPDGMRRGAVAWSAPTLAPTRAGLEAWATVTLGGRAADVVAGEGPHAGARADLVQATSFLAQVHLGAGLGQTLVAVDDEGISRAVALDPRVRALIDADLRRLLARAVAIVAANRAAHARLVDALLERRLLTGAQALAVLGPLAAPGEAEDGEAHECEAQGGATEGGAP